jgi:hypothetical protein
MFLSGLGRRFLREYRKLSFEPHEGEERCIARSTRKNARQNYKLHSCACQNQKRQICAYSLAAAIYRPARLIKPIILIVVPDVIIITRPSSQPPCAIAYCRFWKYSRKHSQVKWHHSFTLSFIHSFIHSFFIRSFIDRDRIEHQIGSRLSARSD